MKDKKMVFIEIDGATWDVINPLLSLGKLPNIEMLMASGASGKLTSIPPLISPKIWTSIFTGKAPSKTGIDFFGANSEMVKCRRIWDIFNENDLKVGVFGTFVTWPPYPINGFMVPSVDSLGTETYPPNLRAFQEVVLNETRKGKGLGGKYASYITYLYYAYKFSLMGVSIRTLVDILNYFAQEKTGRLRLKDKQWKKAMLHLRISTDVFKRLYRSFRPDFATFHIHTCDYVSHRYWKFYEPGVFPGVDSSEIKKYKNVIPEAYIKADKAIGDILQHVSEGTAIVVASDHGFEALSKRGYEFVHDRILEIMGMRKDVIVVPCGGGIYFKFRDRKLMHKAEEILKAVCLKETKEKIFSVKAFQNVLLVTKPTCKVDSKSIRANPLVEFGDFGTYRFNELFSEGQMSGWHSPEGVLMLTGYGVSAGKQLENASIYDLTPTMLYMMGYPVAKDMDGEILIDAFEASCFTEKVPQYIDSYDKDEAFASDRQVEQPDYGKVEERLKSLGYL